MIFYQKQTQSRRIYYLKHQYKGSPQEILKQKSLRKYLSPQKLVEENPEDGTVKSWAKEFLMTYVCCICDAAFWARCVSLCVLITCAILGTHNVERMLSYYHVFAKNSNVTINSTIPIWCLQNDFISEANYCQVYAVMGLATIVQLYGIFHGKLRIIKIWLFGMTFVTVFTGFHFVSHTLAQYTINYSKNEGLQLTELAVMILFILIVYIYYDREMKKSTADECRRKTDVTGSATQTDSIDIYVPDAIESVHISTIAK